MIVVDDESRENEGDLILAASLVTPEAMAFIVRHSTGIVCVSMKENDLERLNLPLMVSTKENEEKLCTAFTITVVYATIVIHISALYYVVMVLYGQRFLCCLSKVWIWHVSLYHFFSFAKAKMHRYGGLWYKRRSI